MTTQNRPQEPGWMKLKDWAEMDGTDYCKALAYANYSSKRTSKVFHPEDLDRRSMFDIRVWNQPHKIAHFQKPRLIPRSKLPDVLEKINPLIQAEIGA